MHSMYHLGLLTPGDWRSHVQEGALQSTSTGHAFNRSSENAKGTHDTFHNYVNNQEGSLPWQVSHVNSSGSSLN